MARVRRTGRTLEGTFESSQPGPRCRLVVNLGGSGALHGQMSFGGLLLWLRGAHANRGRVGAGALSTTPHGSPLAWVRLRVAGDTLQLDLDAIDGSEPLAGSAVVFGREEGEA